MTFKQLYDANGRCLTATAKDLGISRHVAQRIRDSGAITRIIRHKGRLLLLVELAHHD